ncbi:hypothetical protein AVEN_129144-1 [Araneus ventricosus]|uniref:Uncharacterized protein n=1 Tax=Araneus ventricosus TaxID=182803 RepID=A0A4Y2U215_ARAVE|nr:hypothetical protein AVEN_129144-1 [Araneus ventricosus]
MVDKTARTQYSTPDGTAAPETRSRTCNQPSSPANHHLVDNHGSVNHHGHQGIRRQLTQEAETQQLERYARALLPISIYTFLYKSSRWLRRKGGSGQIGKRNCGV